MIARWRQFASDHHQDLVRLPGYLAVSATAFAVDFSLYFVLLPMLPHAFLAAAGGYLFGVVTHYWLSSRVLFADRLAGRGLSAEAPTLMKFFGAGLIGLTITATVVASLADGAGWSPLTARVVAAGCSFGAVYLTLRLLVIGGPTRISRAA